MTSIDPERLAAALRRQVSSLGATASAGRAGAAAGAGSARARPAAAAGSARPTSGSSGPADVAALVARRVQALDRSYPDRHRKAFRVFLESVLLAEFGPALINDAGFHRLVDGVQAEMQSDRELAAQIQGATAALLGERL